MKKVLKENAILKRSCERKRTIVASKKYIRVFLLGLACKKKCIARSRRRRISMFGAFSYSTK
jgi:hypothetical protein